MFGKLMNSYFYGKSGKGDYRKEDLPRTRWALFWEMLRVRFSALVRMNLMYVVVWIPTMLALALGGMSILSTIAPDMMPQEAVVEEGAAVEEDAVVEDSTAAPQETPEAPAAEVELPSPQEALSMVQSIVWVTLLMLVPCIAITGPFTAGLCYVTRNWARDEHAFPWSDYKDAIKLNWKPSLVISVITGLVPMLVYMCWTYYGQLATETPLMAVPQTLTMMMGILWSLSVTYMHPMIVSYKMRIRDVIRNSFLLAIGRLPMSVGIRLLHCVPLLIAFVVAMFISTPAAVFGLAFYYILIGFGLSRFVTASYVNGVFDKYINSRIEGAVVNRGLNTEPDDDEDDEETETAEGSEGTGEHIPEE